MAVAPDQHLVLVGLMGTGKTTVGAHRSPSGSAGALIDTDEVIEARTGARCGRSSPTDGEAAFRALETAALLEALADAEPAVIAAAGGVVLRRREPRRAAAAPMPRSCGCAPTPTCSSTGSTTRRASPAARRRSGGHAAAHARRRASRCTARSPTSIVDVDGRSRRRGRRARSSMRSRGDCARVTVPLGERSYDVLVGHGARRELGRAAAVDGASGRRS